MTFEFSTNPWIAQIQRRLRVNNQNYNVVFTGGNGTGKSWSAISTCLQVDPDFTIDKCVFSAKEFFDLLMGEKLKTGDAIMLDELGVYADNREFMSPLNRALTHAGQVFRHRNLLTTITVPSMSFIDIRLQSLLNFYIEMSYIDREKKIAYGKPLRIQPNYLMGKQYHHHPVRMVNGRLEEISTFNFKAPPANLIKAYEKKKKEFTQALFKEGYETSVKEETKRQKITNPKASNKEILESARADLSKFREDGKLSSTKLALEFDLGMNRARFIKRILSGEG